VSRALLKTPIHPRCLDRPDLGVSSHFNAAMKALILKTFPTEATGPVGDAMASSFRSHILRLEPDCEVDTCGLADDEAVPDPLSYDLVVFTGGTFDLLSPEPHPAWVARAMGVVQAVAGDGQGKTKLLGICWGHQVIHLALDGQLGVLEEGPRVSPQQARLYPIGSLTHI